MKDNKKYRILGVDLHPQGYSLINEAKNSGSNWEKVIFRPGSVYHPRKTSKRRFD